MSDSPDTKVEYKFEHHWGGEDMWYQKAERWANKQKFPFNHLALGIIAWLKEMWIDGKVEMTMQSVDKQAEEIVKQWDEEDERTRVKPEIVETGVFGEEGWSISMSNPVVDRGSKESESGVGTTSNEVRLPEKFPDPWYVNPNDVVIGFDDELRRTSETLGEGQQD